MKQIFKSFTELALELLAAISIIMLFGEAQDAGTQVIYSGASIVVLLASCFGLKKLGAFDEDDEIINN